MSDSGFIDYYQLLGVSTDAEPAEIRRAFLLLAKDHHPDVGGSTEHMQQYTKAYRTLLSESARRAYDLQHEVHSIKSEKYGHSKSDSATINIDDLSDNEIDDFLDTLFREASEKQPKPSPKQRIKKLFEI